MRPARETTVHIRQQSPHVCERPSAGLVGGGKMTTGKQNKLLRLCVRFFLHCFQGQPGVMGVEGQPGLAGYTVSYRYWSFCLEMRGGMNVQKQMMCSLCAVQTSLHVSCRSPLVAEASEKVSGAEITTLAKSECASISLTPFKGSSGFLP